MYVKYQAGFRECADEVANYLGTIDGVSGDVHSRLLSHLHGCMQRIASMAQISAATVTLGASTQQPGGGPLYNSPSYLTVPPLRVQIPHGPSVGNSAMLHGHVLHSMPITQHVQQMYPQHQQQPQQNIPLTPPPSSNESFYANPQSPPSPANMSLRHSTTSESAASDSQQGYKTDPIIHRRTSSTSTYTPEDHSFRSYLDRKSVSSPISRCSSADSLSASSSHSYGSITPPSYFNIKPELLDHSERASSNPSLPKSHDQNMNSLTNKNMNLYQNNPHQQKSKRKRQFEDEDEENDEKRLRCMEDPADDCWRPW